MTSRRQPSDGMRVAINLLTDDPDSPSGAHWFWTRVIREMAAMLAEGEDLALVVAGGPGACTRATAPASATSPSRGRTSAGTCAP